MFDTTKEDLRDLLHHAHEGRWSLEKRFRDALLSRATVIGDITRQGAPLSTLWVAARVSGYRVLENRAFKGPPVRIFRSLRTRFGREMPKWPSLFSGCDNNGTPIMTCST